MQERIYLASSWRNRFQPPLVAALRDIGHEVYDFRHPQGGDGQGFQWSLLAEDWMDWTPEQTIEHLSSDYAEMGFDRDFAAMQWSTRGALLHPSGRSAHIEAGWLKGSGRTLDVILAAGDEPELMIKMADNIFPSIDAYLVHMRKVISQ